MKSNLGKTAFLLASSLALSLQANTNDDPCAVVASEFSKQGNTLSISPFIHPSLSTTTTIENLYAN